MFKFVFSLILLFSGLVAQQPITTVYCHGLGGTGLQAAYCVKDHTLSFQATLPDGQTQSSEYKRNNGSFFLFYHPVHQFDFPSSQTQWTKDETGNFSRKTSLDRSKVSFGQHIEMNTLGNELDSIEGDIILAGHSMGAATIINYVGICQPARIRALILEAPFDSLENLLTHKFGFLNTIGIGSFGRRIAFPAYQSGLNLFKPINAIKLIRQDIPIILIHSKKDSLISVLCSRNLYCTLKEAGHTKVHLYELEDAGHNDAVFSKDAHNYQKVVHAFYQAYHLPHDTILAEAGRALLDTTQPSIEEVQKRK